MRVGVLLAIFGSSGCFSGTLTSTGGGGDDGDGTGDNGGDDTGGDDTPAGAPTYYRDALPILQAKCASCHASGGAAFPLDSYGAAAAASGPVSAATAARVMPPWPPDPACQTFEGGDHRVLSDAQIDTLRRWHEAGAPEGDPADAPAPPAPPPTLGEPDLVLDAGGDYVFDNATEDLYWCFRLPADFGAGLDVVAAEIEPGNRALVHHVIVFREPGGAAQPKGLPGFECGGVPPRTDFFYGWVPGAAPATFPAGMGLRIEGNDALVMQVHYHRNTGATPMDRTRLLLHRADGPLEKTLRVVWTGSIDISVPPGGEATASGECRIPAGAGPIEVVSTAPHMHQIATSFRSVVSRGGSETCLVDIPRWDFEWQGGYRFPQPLILQAGDTIRTTCTYRNPGSQTVGFGEGTTDEMCFQFLFVADDGRVPEKCFAPCDVLPCDALGF